MRSVISWLEKHIQIERITKLDTKMKNLDEQLDKETTMIRNYLLNRLDETAAEEIGERIVTDPEFLEMVMLAEEELLEDAAAGRLSNDESSLVKMLFGRPANREKLEFDRALYKFAERARKYQESVKTESSASQKPPLFAFLTFRPYLVFGTVVLVLVAGISWFFFFSNSKRSGIEAEVARLNRDRLKAIQPGLKLQEIVLQANSSRAPDSPMPRIQITASDEIVQFELGLINTASETYIATFLDDRGNELFAARDLKALSKNDGSYVYVLIPCKFLQPGDFQVSLQGRTDDGTMTRAGSYAFRIIKR